MKCPRCPATLETTRFTRGRMIICPDCGGSAPTVELLRRFAPKERVDDLWREARDGHVKSVLHCPGCEAAMRRVTLVAPGHTVQLDCCRLCHLVWFDADELKEFSPERQAPPTDEERKAVAGHLGIDHEREPMRDEIWRFFGSLGNLFG